MSPEGDESAFLLDRLDSILPPESSSSNVSLGAPYLAKEVVALLWCYVQSGITLDSRLDDVKIAEGWIQLTDTRDQIGKGGGDLFRSICMVR